MLVNTFSKIYLCGDIMSSFQERIIQLKAEKNVLQKDCAEACGISVRGYQYYEKGMKEPTLSKLLALADFFDVSIDYLVGKTDNPEVNK